HAGPVLPVRAADRLLRAGCRGRVVGDRRPVAPAGRPFARPVSGPGTVVRRLPAGLPVLLHVYPFVQRLRGARRLDLSGMPDSGRSKEDTTCRPLVRTGGLLAQNAVRHQLPVPCRTIVRKTAEAIP